MLTLPFKPYSNLSYGMQGSMMEVLPDFGGSGQGSGQTALALNTFNGNLFVKTNALLIEELGGTVDLSYCYNSLVPTDSAQWHLSCVSQIIEQSQYVLMILEADGSRVEYRLAADERNKFYAPKNTPHAGAVCIKQDSGSFIWYEPSSGNTREYARSGLLLNIVNAKGHELVYVHKYNPQIEQHQLVSIAASSGNQYCFSWESNACEISLKEINSQTLEPLVKHTFTDNTHRYLSSSEIIRGSNRYSEDFSYENALLKSISQQDGTSITFKLSKSHQLKEISFEDRATYVMEATSLQHSLLIKVKSPLNKAGIIFTHDESGRYETISSNILHEKDPRQTEALSFAWDFIPGELEHHMHQRHIKKIIHTDGSYQTFGYNTFGQITHVCQYDVSDVLLSQKEFKYSDRGLLIATSDLLIGAPNSQETTQFIYDIKTDGRRELTFVVHPGGEVEYFTYNDKNLLEKSYQHFRLYQGVDITLEALKAWQAPLSLEQNALMTSYVYNERGQVVEKNAYEGLLPTGQENSNLSTYKQTLTKSITGALLSHSTSGALNTLIKETYERDAIDRVTKHTTALQEETTTQYKDRQKTSKLPSNLEVTDTFNQSHQLVRRSYLNGSHEIRSYTDSGKLSSLTTREGLTTHYFYNKQDELAYEVNDAGEVTSYHTNYVTNTSITSRFSAICMEEHPSFESLNAFVKAHESDSDNRIHYKITDSLGQVRFELNNCDVKGHFTATEFRYNSLGDKIEQIAYNNSLTFAEVFELSKTKTMPDDKKDVKDRHSYDVFSHGKLVATVDAAGYVVFYEHNGAGLKTATNTINAPLAKEALSQFLATPTLATLKDKVGEAALLEGAKTLHYYNSAGKKTLDINPLGYVTGYDYYQSGEMKSQRRYATALELSALELTQPPSLPEAQEEDEFITYVYDINGHCRQEIHSNDGYEILTSYDESGNVTFSATQALNAKTTGDSYRARSSTFNNMGEKIMGLNPIVMLEIEKIEKDTSLSPESKEAKIKSLRLKHQECLERDNRGLVTASSNALGGVTHYLYGKQNRLICDLSPAGTLTLYGYNAFGEQTEKWVSTDFIDLELINHLFSNHDTAGLQDFSSLVHSGFILNIDGVVPHFVKTRTEYNQSGLVSKKVDADGYRHITTYNAFNEIDCERQQIKKSSETEAETFLETSYEREKRGLVETKKVTSSDGLEETADYKKFDNPLGKCTYHQTSDEAAYFEKYDAIGRLVSHSMEAIDARTGEKALVGLETNQWDAFSRLTEHRQKIDKNTDLVTAYIHIRKNRCVFKIVDNTKETTQTNIFGETTSHTNAKGLTTHQSHTAVGDIYTKSDEWPQYVIKMRLINTFDMAGRLSESLINNELKKIFSRNKDGVLTKKLCHDIKDIETRVDDYQVNVLGQTFRHIDATGLICDYQHSARGLLELTTIDPSGLNIQTLVRHNGLKQKVFESLSDDSDSPSYETAFTQDALSRAQSKIIDPSGLALTTGVMRNKANKIVQDIDGNGNKSHKILDGRGNPLLTISAMGIVKECRYNFANQVTYSRSYKKQLSQEVISTLLSDDAVKNAHKKQHYKALFEALDHISTVDDKQLVNIYNSQGKKARVAKHFYDHESGQHKAYVHEYTYSKTGKELSQRSYKAPILVNNIDEYSEFNDEGEIEKKIQYLASTDKAKVTHFDHSQPGPVKFNTANRPLQPQERDFFTKNFCMDSMQTQLSSICGNVETDRQTFYFYDEADRQIFIITPTGAVTENIFNDKNQIIHVIEHGELLEGDIRQRLKVRSEKPGILKQAIRQHLTPHHKQNLHTHHVFDAYKNPLFTVNSTGAVTRYCYDKKNNKLKTIHFERLFYCHDISDYSQIDQFLYDNYSLESITEKDRVYQDVYDKAGRLIKEIDPNHNADVYKRNCADLIISHTDRAGKNTGSIYDLAKRKQEEVLPEALITDVLVSGVSKKETLTYETTSRSVRNGQTFDKTDKIIEKTNDIGADERKVQIHLDLDGRHVGTLSKNIEVDDKTKTPDYLFDFPVKEEDISTSVVLNSSDKPLVVKNENDAFHFNVYDGLDRLIYEVNASGLVTFYERDEFNSPLKSIQFSEPLIFSQAELKDFIQNGISESYLKEKKKTLTTSDDRIKQYTYSDEGLLKETITGLRHYFNPASGDFYQSTGLIKQKYDAFGRMIERLTLVDAKPNERWHKHYFWYDQGHRHHSIEAESFISAISDDDDDFMITVTRYDAFSDPFEKCLYSESVKLDEQMQKLSFDDFLSYLKKEISSDEDTIYRYQFNFEGKEAKVQHYQRKHQEINEQGVIIDALDQDNAPRKDIELECVYAPRGERFATLNAKGDYEWAFFDSRGLPFAVVERAVVSEVNEAGEKQLAYPLTYFYHNAHGEEVGKHQFWYGAALGEFTDPYQLPEPLKEALEKDFLCLELKDSRGLTKLKQEGDKKTAYTSTAGKQKAREYVSRLKAMNSSSQRVIDEKRLTYNFTDQVVKEEFFREGKPIDRHSIIRELNTWDECKSKYFLNAVKDKDISKWSQGHAWFSHLGKDLPTLQFTNMVNDVTLSVTAQEEVLSDFNNEEQAIDFIKNNLYNNQVLKDIKSYDFAHHALKHQRPATQEISTDSSWLESNRTTFSEFDRRGNNTAFINEKGAKFTQTYTAHNKPLKKVDPPIRSMIPKGDPYQGDLTYGVATTQHILQNGYDINGDDIGHSEGFINVDDGTLTMRPAIQLTLAPNGLPISALNELGIVTDQISYSAMKLPVSVLSHGLMQPFELTYQGINVDEIIFSDANIGTYMSGTKLSYKKFYDVKTSELIGIGVPTSDYNTGNHHYSTSSMRYDDLGYVCAQKLPCGQKTTFINDFNGHHLQVSSSLLTTDYKRHPFSGVIKFQSDEGANGVWQHQHNRLNLVTIKEQLSCDLDFSKRLELRKPPSNGMPNRDLLSVHTINAPLETITTYYNAELIDSTHSTANGSSRFYQHDDCDNVICSSADNAFTKEVINADYNAMNQVVLQTRKGKFSQRYEADPFYNQVLSHLSIQTESGRNIELALANSFNNTDQLVRNGVAATMQPSGFIAHMPSLRQGGINVYSAKTGYLQQERFKDKALSYHCDSMSRLSLVSYSKNDVHERSKYLLYDIKGPVRYVILGSNVVDNSHPILPFKNKMTERSLIFNQNRLEFIFDENFTRVQYHDSVQSIIEDRVHMLKDGLTVNETWISDNSPNWDKATLQYLKHWQDYKLFSANSALPVTYYSQTECQSGDHNLGERAQNQVYYAGSQVCSYQTKEHAFVSTLAADNLTRQITKLYREPIKGARERPKSQVNNRINYQLLVGVKNEYLARLTTTDLAHSAIDSFVVDLHQKYTGERYNGEYLIKPRAFKLSYIKKGNNDTKYAVLKRDTIDNDTYTAEYKIDNGSALLVKNQAYGNSVQIADPVNTISILQAAITPPAWVSVESNTTVDSPTFADNPAFEKAMLPYLANAKGELAAGILLPLSKAKKQKLKMGTTASIEQEIQKILSISSPASMPFRPKEKDETLEMFISVLVSAIIVAIAPASAGFLFGLEAGASASATQLGITAALLDAGLKGSANQLHLISHYAILDSVAVGLSAGLGQSLGLNAMIGKTSMSASGLAILSKEQLFSILKFAIATNLSNQLINAAEHKQKGFKIESLLASIASAFTRQMVGIRPNDMGNVIGNTTVKAVQIMTEVMAIDLMGAAIQGQEVNMQKAVVGALCNHSIELAQSLFADQKSLAFNAKKEKLKGADNLPPNLKKSSQRTETSQKRYNEKEHQKAILAANGHCQAANDGSFILSGEEFIQNFWKNSCYDFDSVHGRVGADHMEFKIHDPSLKERSFSGATGSKTATAQHAAAGVQKAKATALPSVGSSKYGLFSKPAEQQAMFDAAGYLAHESVAKSSSVSDYTNEIYKLAVGVEDMFLHPLQTAQHVADASVHAAKDIYTSRNESARDIITRGVFKHILWQQTATGAEKFGLALNMVAAEATFGVARMGILGRSGKYVPNRTAKLDYGVAFFGKDNAIKYYVPDVHGTAPTLGAQGRPFFHMPLEDSAEINSSVRAAIETGMAPSAEAAWKGGHDIYGISFPRNGMDIRLPTKSDAMGWRHFFSGGKTAVNVKDTPFFFVNKTREFVLPGGAPMPKGSVLFRLEDEGGWKPLIRY